MELSAAEAEPIATARAHFKNPGAFNTEPPLKS
jgi:hypothetical protein